MEGMLLEGGVSGGGEGGGREGRAPYSGCVSGEGVESVGGVLDESFNCRCKFHPALLSSLLRLISATTGTLTETVNQISTTDRTYSHINHYTDYNMEGQPGMGHLTVQPCDTFPGSPPYPIPTPPSTGPIP